jgi:hypothetical protein
MATAPQILKHLPDILGCTKAMVDTRYRALREAEMLPTGGRGGGKANVPISSHEVTTLLLGMINGQTLREVPDATLMTENALISSITGDRIDDDTGARTALGDIELLREDVTVGTLNKLSETHAAIYSTTLGFTIADYLDALRDPTRRDNMGRMSEFGCRTLPTPMGWVEYMSKGDGFIQISKASFISDEYIEDFFAQAKGSEPKTCLKTTASIDGIALTEIAQLMGDINETEEGEAKVA